MSQKTKKKILLNLIIFLFLFILLESLAMLLVVREYLCVLHHNPKILKQMKIFKKPMDFGKCYYKNAKYIMRKPEGLNYKSKPIIIFGCSYAYGQTLKKEQIFSYKLSKLTKRPVYNYAYTGWGPTNMLYLLKNDKSLDAIKDPEYVIYMYIFDHVNRLYSTYRILLNPSLLPVYEEKNGNLVEKKYNPFLYSLYLTRIVDKYLGAKETLHYKNPEKHLKFLNLIFLESKKEIEKKYPKTKFVIIKYPSFENETQYYTEDTWKQLEDNGIKIIDLNDIVDVPLYMLEYKISELNFHPNEKAWDIIVPKVIKKLRL